MQINGSNATGSWWSARKLGPVRNNNGCACQWWQVIIPMNAPVTQLCFRIFRQLCCYNIPFRILVSCLGLWTTFLLAAATSLWIIVFTILWCYLGGVPVEWLWYMAVPVSGRHHGTTKKDLRSKCIALTWPLSHPEPPGETWKKNSHTRYITGPSFWPIRITYSHWWEDWWERQACIFTDQVNHLSSGRLAP